jgi:hypothetical protein
MHEGVLPLLRAALSGLQCCSQLLNLMAVHTRRLCNQPVDQMVTMYVVHPMASDVLLVKLRPHYDDGRNTRTGRCASSEHVVEVNSLTSCLLGEAVVAVNRCLGIWSGEGKNVALRVHRSMQVFRIEHEQAAGPDKHMVEVRVEAR